MWYVSLLKILYKEYRIEIALQYIEKNMIASYFRIAESVLPTYCGLLLHQLTATGFKGPGSFLRLLRLKYNYAAKGSTLKFGNLAHLKN